MNKILVPTLLILAAILLIAAMVVAVKFLIANKTNGQIVSMGQKRKYLLYVPKSYNPATPVPLVISIHGFIEWPAHQRDTSHWNSLADEYGFIVVYPEGSGFPLRWRTHGQSGSKADPMLDVAFISDLIDRLETEYNIDRNRIYANGLSNGGGMSFVLACKLSERIAAIGTVAGAYSFQWSGCNQNRPVPAIVFHGTADPIVPYYGGRSGPSEIPFAAVPEWVGTLARRNGCSSNPTELPAVGEVSGVQYINCTANADVVFYTINGGGHSWPGGKPLPKFIVGQTTQDIDASRLMWDFFENHLLRREP